jgi:hypothetical protein
VKCSTPVPAQPDEVAWVCKQCKQGLLLDEQKGLVALNVQYAIGIAPGANGKPFWVADGRVSLHRETYSGNQEREALQFWGSSRRFFVPAFNCPLETFLSLGSNLLVKPPLLQPGPAILFEPVTLALKDLTAVAEFIVMAIEADRKDKLKEIRFSVELSDPLLWILPG